MRIALTLDRDASQSETNDYVRSLLAAGFAREQIDVLGPEDSPAKDYDGIVLGGGCDVEPARYGEAARPDAAVEVDPGRDALDFLLYERARQSRIPVLAICRGLQVVQVAHGGGLVQDLPTQRPSSLVHDTPKGVGQRGADKTQREHDVTLVPGTRLAGLASAPAVDVNSRHHQAVAAPAPGLVVSATSPDGLVEGFEGPADAAWMIGVQWHPENLAPAGDEPSRRLFEEFARAVRAHAQTRAVAPASR
jgi:putative glutamine amidotransferase